jgi:ElaB/YqjD/DUF883 family membrane-anchored ribosome-binding protein
MAAPFQTKQRVRSVSAAGMGTDSVKGKSTLARLAPTCLRVHAGKSEVADLSSYQFFIREGRTMIKKLGYLFMAMFLGLSTLSACATRQVSAGQKAGTPSESAQRAEQRQKAETILKEHEKRLEELRSEARRAGAKAEAELDEAIKDLQIQIENLRKELEKWNSTSGEGWEQFRKDMNAALDDLRKAIDKAFSRRQ